MTRRSAFGFNDGTPRPDQVSVSCDGDGCDETLLVGEETARAHAEGDRPIRCEDCRAALPYAKGEDVTVTGLDDEEGSARVVAVLAADAGSHTLFEDGADPVSVADYWGRTVDPSEAVIRVRYTHEEPDGTVRAAGQPYDFPESAVEAADDADADEEAV